MKDKSYLIGDNTKKSVVLNSLIGAIFYLILSFILGGLSRNNEAISVKSIYIEVFVIRGVITQIQMLILVYLVLRLNKAGYILSMILNMYSIFLSAIVLIISKTADSLPGVISYVGVLIIISLVMQYKVRIRDYITKSDEQKEKLKESENKLYKMAFYDELTNLPNRGFFDDFLEKEIHYSKRNASMISTLFIDLDAFKNINDTMGHKAGDEVLVEMSKRLTTCLRAEDVVSRFGGDEFLVGISRIYNVEDFYPIVKKIMRIFEMPVVVHDVEFFITASVGIAVYPLDGEEAEQLIKNADMAMYTSKERGKNQYTFCTNDMKNDSMRKLKLTNNLYRAIEKKELFLHYQPQINIETNRIIGFEALLRWKNEEFGNVSPGEFIPLAEQTGLIKPIGLLVLRMVCEQCRQCREIHGDHIRISINVSIEQLKDMQIERQIKEILLETQTKAENIEIEITESAAFSKEFDVLGKLIKLKEIGFQIAIDDFGKEYSSLNRIRIFPVDRIKIDMDFIHGISTGKGKDRAIVKTIIQLAKNLGVGVIAEGVETEEQYQFLKSEQCKEIQGYYFYKGMLPNEAEALLNKH